MTAVDIKEDNIVWSGKDFKLSDFVNWYPPPQIVKVEEGYHDDIEEERTLSASQVLTLHYINEFTTVMASDSKSHEIAVPTASTASVEIVCEPCYYESVQELASSALPQYVACQEKHPWLNLDENDVLEVKKSVKKFRSLHLLCFNVNKEREFSLPLDYTARFKALGQCPVLKPTMADIVNYCKFPCVVRFIDDKLKVIHEGFHANYPIGMNQMGALTLQYSIQRKILFTTTWEDERVLPLPLDLKIRVVAAHGAIQNDSGYSKLCKIAHKNIKSEELVLKFLRHGEFKILFEDQKPATSKTDERVDYCDVGPMVPPRSQKPGSGTGAAGSDIRLPVRPPRLLKPGSGTGAAGSDIRLPVRSPRLLKPGSGAGAAGSDIRPPVRPPRGKTVSVEGSETTEKPNKNNGKGKRIRRRTVNLPVGDDDDDDDETQMDDVFGRSVGEKEESILSPVKKVFKDLKQVSRAFKNAIPHPKFSRKHRVTDEVSSDATTSHATTSYVTTSHASSNSSQRNQNLIYNEVRPLPGNIDADRRNDGFLALSHVPLQSKENTSTCKIRNPDDLTTWTISEVSECLRYCHLGEHIERFSMEKIDGCLLAELDEESLNSLGVTDKLHIKKLMKITDGWLPKQDEEYVPMDGI